MDPWALVAGLSLLVVALALLIAFLRGTGGDDYADPMDVDDEFRRDAGVASDRDAPRLRVTVRPVPDRPVTPWGVDTVDLDWPADPVAPRDPVLGADQFREELRRRLIARQEAHLRAKLRSH